MKKTVRQLLEELAKDSRERRAYEARELFGEIMRESIMSGEDRDLAIADHEEQVRQILAGENK